MYKVRWFMNGDESATIYTEDFESYEELAEWKEMMRGSIELFSEEEF